MITVISDVHLGYDKSDKDNFNKFIDCKLAKLNKNDHLVLLGDILDFWREDCVDVSLLGPNRLPRNIDIVARPDPMYSSAKPGLLSFDLETKYAVLIVSGSVVDAPSIIYIPYVIHYLPTRSDRSLLNG